MKKDMILHTRNEEQCALGRTRVRLKAYCSAPWGVLRTLLLLLLLMVEVGEMSGQTQPVGKDFSGTYFIANHARGAYSSSDYTENFYLCPSTNMYAADQPLLTTYKERSANLTNAKWTIQFAKTVSGVDYYYLIHSSNKYLTWHDPMTISDGGNATDRVRLHLQSSLNEEKALFFFTEGTLGDNDYNICLKDENCSKNTVGSLNPAKNNINEYSGQSVSGSKNTGSFTDPIDGETKVWCGGLIGIYEQNDPTGVWYLEDVITRPTISYNLENKILITTAQTGEGITIKYTTDGKTPTSEYGETYSEPFDPPVNTVMIKAIAIVNDEESNVAMFTPPVFLGYKHKYLIQSQGNGWTTGNFQGNHYYMIPGDVDNNGKTKVNTTSMLRPSMQWYILNAGDNYYYIVNNVANARIRYNSDYGVHLDAWDENSANEFKFQIVKSSTAGTYNIIPYGVTVDAKYLNKASGNAGDGALALHNNAADANSRWKFVPQDTPLADTPPFTPSGASTSVYYKIRNGSGTTFHITPPASADGNATATETTDDVTSWYFIQVEDPTTTDWLAYYKIINARTGKALYYNYVNSTSNCLKVGDYDGSNDDYKFAFVKSTTADYYYIVPKSHKDDQLNKISTFYREGSNIKPATTRAAGNNVWTFIAADLFCNNPVFTESGGNIEISCPTPGSEIHYTTDGSTPTAATGTVFTNETELPASNQYLIKAIAVLKNNTNVTSGDPVTLFNRPDIVIKEGENVVDENTYTYDKTAKVPTVDEVSITIGENKYTITPTLYGVSYSNTTNAGTTATVNIYDANENDIWVFLNAFKTFIINQKAVTITADNKKKEYGDNDPTLTATVTGVVDNEDENSITYTISRATGENKGTYTITATGEASQGNYNVTAYNTGTFTITSKALNKDEAGTPADGITITVTKDMETTPPTYNVEIIHDNLGTPTPLVQYENDETDYDYKVVSGSQSVSGYVVTIAAKNESGIYTGNYKGIVKYIYADPTFYVDGATWSPSGYEYAAVYLSLSDALPTPITSGSEIKAYIVKKVNPTIGTVTVSPVEYVSDATTTPPTMTNYIPEGVPVLLLSNNVNLTGFTTSSPTEDTSDITETVKNNNQLMIAPDELSDPSNQESAHGVPVKDTEAYIFYNGEFVLTKEGVIKPDYFFLYNPNYKATPEQSGGSNPAPRRTLQIVIEERVETGMAELRNDELTESRTGIGWYTIDGRKLNGKPRAKGLYIVDGKKVMVK